MVPSETHESPVRRLVDRTRHYVAFAALFLVVYGGLAVTGRFPEELLFGVLLGSLGKDLYDEVRIRRGQKPLAYAGVEHAPSNAVLLAFLLVGVIEPSGSVAGVSLTVWASALAAADLVFDLWQDARA